MERKLHAVLVPSSVFALPSLPSRLTDWTLGSLVRNPTQKKLSVITVRRKMRSPPLLVILSLNSYEAQGCLPHVTFVKSVFSLHAFVPIN